ncbi:phosphotransferase family enzyme [Kribbella amoyensis]|uniref:Phosphotransferase family enzyme n=1 Tax=Kribbella amoyensis TaxID=996641 RepID=A0A561BMQ6_9ACTN|nr:phosphotransferase [Kribbella amoyensis]TWD80134.1 phosphotransferase family enzyme [Kribbella amoyensis]
MHFPLTRARLDVVLDGLSTVCGRRPVVVEAEGVGHEWAPVTRLVFDDELPGLGLDGDGGRSVIVKTRRVDGEGHGGPAYLRREVAGLRTIAAEDVAARVLLVDDEAGLVVQSDLGVWPTLEQILLGHDAERAASAMVEYGRTVGRLHADTLGRRTEYAGALAEFGAADVTTGGNVGIWGTRRWNVVEEACADLGFPDAQVARDDLAYLCSRLAEPGPYAALVHGDLNPTNALVTDRGVRLVDFEGSGFGHVGFDTSFLYYPFPHHSANWSILPDRITAAAGEAYRGTLAEVTTVRGYEEMLAVGAAAALATRVPRLPLMARTDQSEYDSWRRRAQLVHQLGVFARLAEDADCLRDLAGWAVELAEAMSERWPDATSPLPGYYRAFRA